jgi:VWFA-related protein
MRNKAVVVTSKISWQTRFPYYHNKSLSSLSEVNKMKRFPMLLLLVLFSGVELFSQSNRPSASPTPSPDEDVVKITTSLIQLDVTVTDKKGNPISDLRRDEIEIFENGKKKDISYFSFVPGTRASVEKGEKNALELKKNEHVLPAGPVRPESVRRTVAIVVDDLSLSFASTFWVKEALKKFIREQIQDGDLVAIIRTGASIGSLQQFTTDRRQLLSAAERIKWTSVGSGGTSFFSPVTSGLSPNSVGGNAEVERIRDNIFASGTIGALNFVIRGMKELPGRKSVILLTDGINIYTRDSKGRPQYSLSYHALRQMIDHANRTAVSFYPIQAEGLSSPGLTAEDDLMDFSLIGGETISDGIISGRLNKVKDTQDGLRFLAEQTGGFAVVNSNDLGYGMRRVMSDESYYLVAYEPDEATFDPGRSQYNRFDVKVSRPDARVRYRSGFLNVTEKQSDAEKLSPKDSIVTALTSPFRLSQIDVRMNAIFAADSSGNSVVNSFVNIDPAGLTFTPSSGDSKKASFDIVALTFSGDGKVVDQRSKNLTITVTPPQYKALLERGLVTVFSLPVKRVGGYQIRLAIHDTSSGNLGSASQFIDVPSVKSGKLLLSGIVLRGRDLIGYDSRHRE